jgi:hypothetical protein
MFSFNPHQGDSKALHPPETRDTKHYFLQGAALGFLSLANLLILWWKMPPSSSIVPLSPHQHGYFLFLTLMVPLFLALAWAAGFFIHRQYARRPPGIVLYLESTTLLLLPGIGLATLLSRSPGFLLITQGLLYLLILLSRLLALLIFFYHSAVEGDSGEIHTRRFSTLLYLVPFIIYLGLFFLLGSTSSTTGDEPYYLMVAESLARDRDLDLADQMARGTFRNYYWRDRLAVQNMIETATGRLYSTAYTTLFPVLLAPASLLDSRWGPTLVVILISTLLSGQIFRLTNDLCAGLQASFLAWAAASFTLPLLSFSSQIYPETTAALAGVILLRMALFREPERLRGWKPLLSLLLLAVALPALKWRYLPISITGVAVYSWRAKKPKKAFWVFTCLGAALGLILLMDYYLLEGTLLLSRFSSPGKIFRMRKFLRFWPASFGGLMADQEFGLIFHSPVYLLLPIGFLGALRSRSLRSFWLFAPFLTYLILLVGHFGYLWYGGFSLPSRYLVAVLPLMVPFMAYAWEEGRGWLLSLFAAAAFMWSIIVTLPYLLVFNFRYNNADGVNNILQILRDQFGLYIHTSFPSFVNPEAWRLSGYLLVLLLLLLPSVFLIIWRTRAQEKPVRPKSRWEILAEASILLLAVILLISWIPLHRQTGILEAESMQQKGGVLYTGFGRGNVRVYKESGWVKSRIVTRSEHSNVVITAGARTAGSPLPKLAVYLDGVLQALIPVKGGSDRYHRQNYHLVISAPPGKHILKVAVERPSTGPSEAPVYLDRITFCPL